MRLMMSASRKKNRATTRRRSSMMGMNAHTRMKARMHCTILNIEVLYQVRAEMSSLNWLKIVMKKLMASPRAVLVL